MCSLSLTAVTVKVCVIKTNKASIIDHKLAGPGQSQDTVALRGVVKRDRQRETEPETNLFSELSAE